MMPIHPPSPRLPRDQAGLALDIAPGAAVLADAEREIAVLIEVLHETERRLELLTGGEVDTVADREGRTLMLRSAQDALRHSDAAKQANILNALPAHVALLDARGIIVSVNKAWRAFAHANTLPGKGRCAGDAVGLDYLSTCDRAQGLWSSEARPVAAGIRTVLEGRSKSFSMEYPCHSATVRRWFLLIVSPLHGDSRKGAIVMHIDVSAERVAEENLRESELRFRQMAETIQDAYFLIDASNGQVLYINAAYQRIWGRSCESLYTKPESWLESVHPDDRSATRASFKKAMLGASVEFEYRITRADGSLRWICTRDFPIADSHGNIVRITGLASDITERKLAEAAFKLSEFSVNEASAATLWIAQDARILRVNRAACEQLGYSEAELLNKTIPDIDADFRAELWPAHWAELRARRRMTFDTRHRRKDGSVFPVEVDLNWFEFEGREYNFAFVRDITERLYASERIRYLNRVYAVLSGINALIVRVTDRALLYREACQISVGAGGFRMALMGILDDTGTMVPVASAGSENLATAIDTITCSLAGAPSTMVAQAMQGRLPVVSNDSQNDPRVAFAREYAEFGVRSMMILPLLIAGEAIGVLALYADEAEFFHAAEIALLTELAGDIAFAIDHIDKGERLKYLAYYDAPTGLANRNLFLERLVHFIGSAAREQHGLAICLIDIERFKNINDSMGRTAGDALLKQVAEWLTLRTGDATLLARVDADRFGVILPRIIEGGDLSRLLESTRHAFLSHPFCIDGAPFRIAFKGGVAVFPDDGSEAEILFKNAEAALKKAKAMGEPYLFYKQEMTEVTAGKVTLENQLREALERNEFELYYQPKMSLATGKLTGVEALIRWNDPRTGLMAPSRFIRILEEIGLIHEVGRWALDQAIRDYLRWRASGLVAVRVAVNVSPLQLRHRHFVADIARRVGVDASASEGLELEITEGLIMEDVEHSIETLHAIRAMGVRVAIDDFGTGFSSLSYLAKLPVDALKIDRSFILDMGSGPQGLALVSTIIGLAHALKLNVVAEGVETDEQTRLLRLLSCDEIQGFIVSKPMPVQEFETEFLQPST